MRGRRVRCAVGLQRRRKAGIMLHIIELSAATTYSTHATRHGQSTVGRVADVAHTSIQHWLLVTDAAATDAETGYGPRNRQSPPLAQKQTCFWNGVGLGGVPPSTGGGGWVPPQSMEVPLAPPFGKLGEGDLTVTKILPHVPLARDAGRRATAASNFVIGPFKSPLQVLPSSPKGWGSGAACRAAGRRGAGLLHDAGHASLLPHAAHRTRDPPIPFHRPLAHQGCPGAKRRGHVQIPHAWKATLATKRPQGGPFASGQDGWILQSTAPDRVHRDYELLRTREIQHL